MKIAYVYQEDKNLNKVNVYQSYSMVEALSKFTKIFTFRGFSKFSDWKKNPKIKQLRILNLGGFSQKFLVLEKLSRLVFCIHTFSLISLMGVDFIFTRDFGFIYFYSKLPKFLTRRTRLVYESHKIMNDVSEKVSLSQEVEAYTVVDKFIAISDGIKTDLIEKFEIPKTSILVLPNGFDPTLFAGGKRKKRTSNSLNLVYAGSFEKWKGVETIVKASQLVAKDNLNFHILGGSKRDHSKLAAEYEIEKHETITFQKNVKRKDLFQIFNDKDVGIVSTLDLQEGAKYTSPVKFFEYVNAGLLVLASDIAPMKELAAKGFYLEFYEAGSSNSLLEKINEILKQGIDYEKLEANRKLVQSYTWANRASEIVRFIKV